VVHAAFDHRGGILVAMPSKMRAPKKRSKPTRTKQVKPGALRWAAQFGKTAEVQALLASGADPNEVDATSTPLAMACYHRKVPIVRMLLAAGADPNLAPGGGSAPLVYAMTSGSKRVAEMVRMLLEAGAEPNPPAYRNQRLIQMCKDRADVADARALLEAAVEAAASRMKRASSAT
jgi:ankyrin repeat protein